MEEQQLMPMLAGFAALGLPWIVGVALAIAGGVAAPWILMTVSSRPMVGAWLAAIAYLYDATWFGAPPLFTGGVDVTLYDLINSLLAAAALMRLLRRDATFNKAATLTLLLLLGLWFYSLFRGFEEFGKTAGVQSRENFYFFAVALYLASFRIDEELLKKLMRVAVVICIWLIGLAVARWIGEGTGIYHMDLTFLRTEFRSLNSTQASTLMMAALAGTFGYLRGINSRAMNVLTAVSYVMVVILQHRSTWVAGFVALFILCLYERRRLAPKLPPVLLGLFIAMLIVVPVSVYLGWTDSLVAALVESVDSAGRSRGTHTDRMVSWVALVQEWQDYPWLQWAFGRGYGAGYYRVVMGVFEDFSPHNFYVQLLVMIGLVGLIVFVSLNASTLIRFIMRSGNEGESGLIARIFVVLLISNLIYYLPYQGDYPHGMLLGVAVGVLAAMPIRKPVTAYERAAQARGGIIAPVRREPRLGMSADAAHAGSYRG